MTSRGRKQVKRKTLLKVIYLKKLKNLIQNNSYWGFCNFVSSENKIKKNFLIELNSSFLNKGIFFFKVRASYLRKLLILSGLDPQNLNFILPLFQGSFVLMLTNDLLNVINFPFKDYAETKLVVYAWKLNTQLFNSRVFFDRTVSLAISTYPNSLLYSLRKNVEFLRLLNVKFSLL